MFPDTQHSGARGEGGHSLAMYFDDTRVEALISVYDEASSTSSRRHLGVFAEAPQGGEGTAAGTAMRLVDNLTAAASGVRSFVAGASSSESGW